jgi:YD repeat-containing protein
MGTVLLEKILSFPAPKPRKIPTILDRASNKLLTIELQNGEIQRVQCDPWGNGIEIFQTSDEDFEYAKPEEKDSNKTKLGEYILKNFSDVKNVWIEQL